ncbi:MAG: 4Fe-4S dicluster domain-containing protein [Desulfohalobiaceae bacterium]|nr:4Fe-4S dicluster domain-containing protein [Desulfohalobiaceae bacterium]
MDVVKLDAGYDKAFVDTVAEESGQDPYLCYQCGNCTAGCPYTFVYDLPVHQIMRLLQAGQKEMILKSHSLWLCATCESCTTRCPNQIDVAGIMDVLRHMARREGHIKEKQVKQFTDSFLSSVKKHGRVFEFGTLVKYITRSGRVWTDFDLGPKVMRKGKIAPRPHNIKGKEEVARIFRSVFGEENDEF